MNPAYFLMLRIFIHTLYICHASWIGKVISEQRSSQAKGKAVYIEGVSVKKASIFLYSKHSFA